MLRTSKLIVCVLVCMTTLFGASLAFAAVANPGKTKFPDTVLPTKVNTISGFVYNSYGKGLGGVTVSFGNKSFITNSDGSYVIIGLPEQQYSVHLSKTGYLGTSSLNYVAYENGRYNRNFIMYGTARLHGTVFDYYRNNARIGDADITLNDATTTTGGNGEFELQTAPGKYTLKISKPGFKTYTQTIELSGDFSKKSEVFSIMGALTLKGFVKDNNGAPLAGAIVDPMFSMQEVVTGPDGSYTITAMGPGTYLIKVSKMDYATVEKEITIGVDSNLKQDFTLIKN